MNALGRDRVELAVAGLYEVSHASEPVRGVWCGEQLGHASLPLGKAFDFDLNDDGEEPSAEVGQGVGWASR